MRRRRRAPKHRKVHQHLGRDAIAQPPELSESRYRAEQLRKPVRREDASRTGGREAGDRPALGGHQDHKATHDEEELDTQIPV